MTLLSIVALLGFLAQGDPSKQARELIEKLRSESLEDREMATRTLKKLGPAATSELKRAAKDEDLEVARRASGLLLRLEMIQQLTPRLLETFSGLEDRLHPADLHSWTTALLEALAETDKGLLKHPELRRADLEVLASRALRGAESSEEKVTLLYGVSSHYIRSASAAMVTLIKDPDDEVQFVAARVLVELASQRELPELTALLKDKDPGVRSRVAGVLGRLPYQESGSAIVPLLQDKEFAVQDSALAAIVNLGFKGAAPEIAEFLKGVRLQARAVEALGSLGDPRYISDIARLLENQKDAWAVATVVQTLGRLGGKDWVPRIAEILKQRGAGQAGEGSAALWALGELGAKEHVSLMEPYLEPDHSDVGCRAATIHALWRLDVRHCARKLVPLLKDKDGSVKGNARRAILYWDARETIPDLKQLLAAAPVAAMQSLADLQEPSAVALVTPYLRDPKDDVRQQAAEALCQLGCTEAVPLILEKAGVWHSLSFLNALRQPDLWRRLDRNVIADEWKRPKRTLQDILNLDLGIRIEVSEDYGTVQDPSEVFLRRFLKLDGMYSVIDSLEAGTWTIPCDFILESDRIRILPLSEALLFWTNWWKAQQEKKQ